MPADEESPSVSAGDETIDPEVLRIDRAHPFDPSILCSTWPPPEGGPYPAQQVSVTWNPPGMIAPGSTPTVTVKITPTGKACVNGVPGTFTVEEVPLRESLLASDGHFDDSSLTLDEDCRVIALALGRSELPETPDTTSENATPTTSTTEQASTTSFRRSA
jgi:hypothetical protein